MRGRGMKERGECIVRKLIYSAKSLKDLDLTNLTKFHLKIVIRDENLL